MIDELRARFRDGRCRHVVIPDLVDSERSAIMRAQLDEAGFEAFYEPDRGRYEINRNLDAPALFDELREWIESIVDAPLRVGPAWWLRLRHRDYELIKGDAKTRGAGNYFEVTLDVSERATDQAEIVYTDGAQSWVVPQRPGTVTLVEREPWLFRYDRYLNGTAGNALIYRMRLALRPLARP